DEVPAAARVRPREVRAHAAVAAVAHPLLRVLAVHVVDAVLEVPQEAHRVDVLPDHVARVPVEAERLAVPDRLERTNRRPVVVRGLARVALVREPHGHRVEHVEDRVPAVREVLVPGVDRLLGDRREHRDVLPDGRPREAHDGLDAELRRDPRGVLHLLRGALAHALGVAVAPHDVRQDVAVALVDRVLAHRLALEVVRDRADLEVVLRQQVELALDVLVVVPAPGVEVVPPAGDLQPVVAPAGREPRHLLERQVGPLPGEEGDRSCHGRVSFGRSRSGARGHRADVLVRVRSSSERPGADARERRRTTRRPPARSRAATTATAIHTPAPGPVDVPSAAAAPSALSSAAPSPSSGAASSAASASPAAAASSSARGAGSGSGTTSTCAVAVASAGSVIVAVRVQLPSARTPGSDVYQPTPSDADWSVRGPTVSPSADSAVTETSADSSTGWPSSFQVRLAEMPPSPSVPSEMTTSPPCAAAGPAR